MREIVLDTETTGLSHSTGDRIVEIGCVELVNRFPTGKTYHCYINPERDMPEGAFRVHGLSIEFLSDKPLFAHIADAFIDFIGNDPLVIHNADFDMGFINFELTRLTRTHAANPIVNTLLLARRKHPGASNRLDDLCTRYGIDNSKRTMHGALLDAQLLAEVYAELIGGRQTAMLLKTETEHLRNAAILKVATARPQPLAQRLSADEHSAHAAFVQTLSKPAIWAEYQSS